MNIAETDALLSTTRSVRKRLDFSRPVEAELLEDCIDLALQSPTGSNQQGWHVVVVTDEDKRKAIADVYREGFTAYQAMKEGADPGFGEDDMRAEQMPCVYDSAGYLAEKREKAPAFVLFCVAGRVENSGVTGQASSYGPVRLAAWSFMLAGRARGLGMALSLIQL